MRKKVITSGAAKARMGVGNVKLNWLMDIQPVDGDEDHYSPVYSGSIFTLEDIESLGYCLEFDQDEWPTSATVRIDETRRHDEGNESTWDISGN